MAKWELSPAFTRVRKKLGNMVYYDIDGEIHARKLPSKPETVSPAQSSTRASFKKVSGDWKYLTGVIQDSWKSIENRKKRRSAYDLFLGANITPQRNGKALTLTQPYGQPPLSGFTAQAGSSSGEIDCEFTWSTGHAGKHVTFFVQKKEDGLAAGEIIRFDAGADPSSPFTLEHLEAGGEYFIYAVVTESAYEDSHTVSIARSASAPATT